MIEPARGSRTLAFDEPSAGVLELFHPLIQQWFHSRFQGPTEPQEAGWPSIHMGQDTLIAAPTGSGKTLTAFLAAIDRLFRRALTGDLADQIAVVYVSPLRALSNDMHRNLEVPLAEILDLAQGAGLEIPPIRAGLRTGDTSASQRAAIVRKPPHILVTTPESLYLMLTGVKSRERLRHVETIIVDELHALVRDKRGSHLALTLERLAAHCESRPQRIGLSATQRPIERTAAFLVGGGLEEAASGEWLVASGEKQQQAPNLPHSPLATRHSPLPPTIIDVGHRRPLDLALEIPPSELGAVCSGEQWNEVNARIVELVNSHRSTLIFVNTRRLAERLTHQLSELLGEDQISSHHGSLSAEMRLGAEQRLKTGQLKAVVATASLELGLDVGYIDLVIQIGSPRAIATFLQRVGRSGHALGLTPKGRIFALTRDELLECMALIRGIRAGRLDAVEIPVAPLDILAQQIVSEVAHEEWSTDDLFALVRRAAPYRDLPRARFDQVLQFLSEGISSNGNRSRVYLHHDQVRKRVRARPGASLAAAQGGGAIPEIASYRVVTEPERTMVGTVDEDFAVESAAGDVFLLGNTSWRIQYVRGGEVVVHDAHGSPPSIPFWLGEAPGRTLELSAEVSTLREELEQRVADPEAAQQWLVDETLVDSSAAVQIVHYVAAQKAALGLLPTQRRVIFERFFDETGGMQLVIHAPFGGRITRAWGLALRKRFCRSFDFELQATADDDGLMLSLGPQHSFPLESMFNMLNPTNARPILEQAVLAAPMFQTRWRWNVTRALLVMRSQNGKKVPPPLQRFRSEDLLTAVFPALTGCKEEIVGDIPLPDHPLAVQTMEDCLHEALSIEGLQDVFGRVARGEIEFIARDTREPSPFSYELLNANPYAFLDGGEIQERRARAVQTRRTFSVESVSDLGRLDPEAIAQVRRDAQPLIRNADELHDALMSRFVWPVDEDPQAHAWYAELAEQGRATTGRLPDGRTFWTSAERLPAVRAGYPAMTFAADLAVPESVQQTWDEIEARLAAVRGWLEISGPVWAADVAERLGLTHSQAHACLEALEGEGVVLRGQFTNSENPNRLVPSEQDASPEDPLADGTGVPPGQPADVSVPRALPVSSINLESEAARAEPVAHQNSVLQTKGESYDLPKPPKPADVGVPPALPVSSEVGVPRALPVSSINLESAPARAEPVAHQNSVLQAKGENYDLPKPADVSVPPAQPADAGVPPGQPADVGVPRALPVSSINLESVPAWAEPVAHEPVAHQNSVLQAKGESYDLPKPPKPLEEREWCHRRLLARIHRLTLDGLRREIEPVGVETFIRFLARHHGLIGDTRPKGTNGVFDAVALLQGIDAPAVSWERDLLPARVGNYEPGWLDELCLTGEVSWGRLFPPVRDPERSRPMASLTRVAPMSLFLRSDLEWLTVQSRPLDLAELSSPSQEVFEILDSKGAMFAADVLAQTRLLPSQLDECLGELIAQGYVNADGFAGLRRLITSKSTSHDRDRRRARGMIRIRANAANVGRWSLWRRPPAPTPPAEPETKSKPPTSDRLPYEIVEQWAWQLLRRWGVMFRDLLIREPGAPRWFELLQVYRKLEARGEIRGGRFISGVAGEQFAVGETVHRLRRLRDEVPSPPELTLVSAADPLNLVGILTHHPRVPSTASNRVAYLNGQPAAGLHGGEVIWLGEFDPAEQRRVRERLERESLRDAEPAAPDESPRASGEATASPAPAPPAEPSPSHPNNDRPEQKPRRRTPPPPRYPNGIPRPKFW